MEERVLNLLALFKLAESRPLTRKRWSYLIAFARMLIQSLPPRCSRIETERGPCKQGGAATCVAAAVAVFSTIVLGIKHLEGFFFAPFFLFLFLGKGKGRLSSDVLVINDCGRKKDPLNGRFVDGTAEGGEGKSKR